MDDHPYAIEFEARRQFYNLLFEAPLREIAMHKTEGTFTRGDYTATVTLGHPNNEVVAHIEILKREPSPSGWGSTTVNSYVFGATVEITGKNKYGVRILKFVNRDALRQRIVPLLKGLLDECKNNKERRLQAEIASLKRKIEVTWGDAP